MAVRISVRKSAFAAPGERPSVEEHYATNRRFGSSVSLFASEITVLDDVITRGATLFTCVRRLREFFPDAIVRAFAVVRTLMGYVPQVDRIVEPVENGIITLEDGAPYRRP